MNFEVGKRYRTRGGRVAKLILVLPDNVVNHFVWLLEETDDDWEMAYGTHANGVYNVDGREDDDDIISDVPVKDAVKVEIQSRFVVVSGDTVSGNYSHREDAVAAAKHRHAIGIAELPATLLVEPV